MDYKLSTYTFSYYIGDTTLSPWKYERKNFTLTSATCQQATVPGVSILHRNYKC